MDQGNCYPPIRRHEGVIWKERICGGLAHVFVIRNRAISATPEGTMLAGQRERWRIQIGWCRNQSFASCCHC